MKGWSRVGKGGSENELGKEPVGCSRGVCVGDKQKGRAGRSERGRRPGEAVAVAVETGRQRKPLCRCVT